MPENGIDNVIDELAASVENLGVDITSFIEDVQLNDHNQNSAIAQANASLQVLQGNDNADKAEIDRLRQALTDLQNSNLNTNVQARLTGIKTAIDGMAEAVKSNTTVNEPVKEFDNVTVGTPATPPVNADNNETAKVNPKGANNSNETGPNTPGDVVE